MQNTTAFFEIRDRRSVMSDGAKTITTTVKAGWVVLDARGQIVVWEWEFGYGCHFRGPLHPSKKDAQTLARLHAERKDELNCGDINRWEMGNMPSGQVRARGYKTRRARLISIMEYKP